MDMFKTLNTEVWMYVPEKQDLSTRSESLGICEEENLPKSLRNRIN
jgi:hypothetical protein